VSGSLSKQAVRVATQYDTAPLLPHSATKCDTRICNMCQPRRRHFNQVRLCAPNSVI